MALLWSRILCRRAKNNLLVLPKYYSNGKDLPAPGDLATGMEKFEMDQLKAGNDDPFKMRAVKRHASTKTNPNIVPSYYDCRVVGCVCEEDSNHVVWMWLFKGEPKRCKCGHWFKLEEYNPV